MQAIVSWAGILPLSVCLYAPTQGIELAAMDTVVCAWSEAGADEAKIRGRRWVSSNIRCRSM